MSRRRGAALPVSCSRKLARSARLMTPPSAPLSATGSRSWPTNMPGTPASRARMAGILRPNQPVFGTRPGSASCQMSMLSKCDRSGFG
ncbi:hypothetical protein ETAA1_36400 [Urbifossiella limnaea]|uniref:Uncharacterized protein n=1 Tax=Urbifossiella limnaea TaxID=2528023 RepID=A0A517XVZ2_9BACT|nr:hypothetical protein ETAA1_36400 [Urbifossiella limnaea]